MAQNEQDMKTGIAEAISESDWKTEEDNSDDEWDSFEAEAEATDDGASETAAAPAEGESSKDETTSEPPAASEATGTEDVPEVYWGVDLSDIPAEKRAGVIAHFEQQDSQIRKLQEKLAQSPQEETPPAPNEEQEEITDADILRTLGYDPEYVSEEDARPILALAKNQMALEEQLEALTTERNTESVEKEWNSAVKDLEETYGSLPVDPEQGPSEVQLLRFALAEGITSPFEAYFKATAPIRKEVETAATAARREALKLEQSGGVRPRTSTAGDIGITKGMSLKEAVAKGAKMAEKETKLSWRDALSKRRVATGE